MIEVTFSNVSEGGSSTVNLKSVRSVQFSSFAEEDVFVDQTSRVGKRRRKIVVNGFINKSMFNENIAAQEQLESDLRSVGFGTLTYTGMTDLTDVRFVSLEFQDFRGNPLAEFSITFSTNEENIHAHATNKIGSITLIPANGYEEPTVRDVLRSQGPDEQIVNNKSRGFILEGDIVGATLDEVNTAQAAIVAEVENKDTVVLTLSSAASAPGAYTVRTERLEFSSPRIRENNVARRYTFQASTYDDYSKEPYTLGEVAQTFSSITIDVLKGVSHKVERSRTDSGPLYLVEEESLIVSGKKYFTGWTAYKTFVDLFDPIPGNTYLVASTTGNVLELIDADIGEMERDGNFSADNSKRYSASVSLTFKWIKSYEFKTYEFQSSHFGVTWFEVQSVTFGSTVNDKGHVTSRTVSVSGTVLGDTVFSQLKGTVGTKIDWDTTYVNLYVTSVSVNSIKLINTPGLGVIRVFDVSVTASQLDNASQAYYFLTGIFKMSKAGGSGTSYDTDQFVFDSISNRSKSIANRWNGTQFKFTVTSINISVSGEIFDNDNGVGAPANPDKNVDLFNKIDALLNAEKSTQGGVNVHSGGLILPGNSDIHFILTNINIGGWDSFTDEASGARRWKQTVSLSATAVFDLAGSSTTEPDTVETRSENIVLEAPKYQQIQIVGFGTVFKRIGTTPEKLVVTYQKRWKNSELYRQDNLTGLDFGADNVSEGTWRGSGKNVKTKDQKENRGLVNRHIVEYTANEKLGS